ncbi:MAG: dynamin family protein, partial [Terracidiphilus sp.]
MQEHRNSSTAQDSGGLPDETPVPIDGSSRLLRLGSLARELGAEPVAEEARELAARISEGRFYVACVGQFKRGKSTLLNALVGQAVVPTGFVPVTAVPTVIRFGGEPRARVRMRDGSWQDVALTAL